MTPRRESQTWLFLRGDLAPHTIDQADLRNDHAGDEMQQTQSVVLRYLGSLGPHETADLDVMVSDITRHYPFHGKGTDFFRKAVDELKKEGWIKVKGSELTLDKVAGVTKMYLSRIATCARQES